MELRLQETYLLKLRRASSELETFLAKHLKRQANMGLAELLFLQTVKEKQPVKQGKIAEILNLSPGRVSRLTDQAKTKGWINVTRYEEDADRRIQVLEITDTGSAKLQKGLEALSKHAFYIFNDQDSPGTLMQHIDRLLEKMEERDRQNC